MSDLYEYEDDTITEEDYRHIIIPEIKEYIYPFDEEEHSMYDIKEFTKNILSTDYKSKFIKYIQFINNTNYNIDYISKLIYLKYVRYSAFCLDDVSYDTEYDENIYTVNSDYIYIYQQPEINKIVNDVVSHYESTDKEFANYIKSLDCLLWIISNYKNIYDDIRFNECDYERLKKLLTPKIKEQLRKEDLDGTRIAGSLNSTEEEELKWYGEIISLKTNKYQDIYRKAFYTGAWDLMDLSCIVEYINRHDLDTFTVLNRLAADYSWATNKVKPNRSGIQSTSGSIIEGLNYKHDNNMDRTEEVEKMVNEIDNIKTGLYLEDFSKSYKTLTELFKRTFEKRLQWGLKIF